jgi:prepilin peptidase CpaA
MPVLQILPLIIFPALVVGAALRDATSYTIPNWLSLAAAGLFFPAAFAVGLPLHHMEVAVGVGFAALVVGIGMFAAGWVGGGDA